MHLFDRRGVPSSKEHLSKLGFENKERQTELNPVCRSRSASNTEIEQEEQPRETILQHHESIASDFFEK